MAERDPNVVPTSRGPARVTLACRDREEFLRDFVPRCHRQGVFVATRHLPPVGTRIQMKMMLLDGSVVFCGDAVVAVYGREGSCPGIRVRPEMPELADPPAEAPPPVPAPVPIARLNLERTFRSPEPPPSPAPEEAVAGWRSLLADRLEALAAGALKTGNLQAAAAHCHLALQADPTRTGPRALLQQLGSGGGAPSRDPGLSPP